MGAHRFGNLGCGDRLLRLQSRIFTVSWAQQGWSFPFRSFLLSADRRDLGRLPGRGYPSRGAKRVHYRCWVAPMGLNDRRILYLIRHADTGLADTFVGHWDVPLSELGIRQAEELARQFQDAKVDALYSSDLRRATRTAEALARPLRLEIRFFEDLRERNMGNWQGLRWEEVAERFPDEAQKYLHNWAMTLPGGESLRDMRKRVLRAWRSIWAEDWERGVIVAHGGTNRILLAHFLEIPDKNLFRIAQDNATMNCVEFTGGTPMIRKMNA